VRGVDIALRRPVPIGAENALESPGATNGGGSLKEPAVDITFKTEPDPSWEGAGLTDRGARSERRGEATLKNCRQASDHGEIGGGGPGEAAPKKSRRSWSAPILRALHRLSPSAATQRPWREHRLTGPIQSNRSEAQPQTLDSRSLSSGYTPATHQGAGSHHDRQSRRSQAWSESADTGLSTRWSRLVERMFDPGGVSQALSPMVVTPERIFLQSGNPKVQVRGHFTGFELLQSGTTKCVLSLASSPYKVSTRFRPQTPSTLSEVPR
jgi:hypothetical protein